MKFTYHLLYTYLSCHACCMKFTYHLLYTYLSCHACCMKFTYHLLYTYLSCHACYMRSTWPHATYLSCHACSVLGNSPSILTGVVWLTHNHVTWHALGKCLLIAAVCWLVHLGLSVCEILLFMWLANIPSCSYLLHSYTGQLPWHPPAIYM